MAGGGSIEGVTPGEMGEGEARGQELLLVTTNYSYIIILGSSCTFVDFKTKYLWNIALHWPGWLYVCICHQK